MAEGFVGLRAELLVERPVGALDVEPRVEDEERLADRLDDLFGVAPRFADLVFRGLQGLDVDESDDDPVGAVVVRAVRADPAQVSSAGVGADLLLDRRQRAADLLDLSGAPWM